MNTAKPYDLNSLVPTKEITFGDISPSGFVRLNNGNILALASELLLIVDPIKLEKISSFEVPQYHSVIQLDNDNIILYTRSSSIHIFSFKDNQLKEEHVIPSEQAEGYEKLCKLSKNRFLAFSEYNGMKVFKGDAPYSDEPIKEIEYCPYGAKQLEGKEILVAGNVSYEECIVLFETENFTKIKKFENKPILRTGSICEVDEDTIAIEASFLNIKTGELNSFTEFYGACYDANIKLRDGRLLYAIDYNNEWSEQRYDSFLALVDPKTKTMDKKQYPLINQFFKLDDESFLTCRGITVELWKY